MAFLEVWLRGDTKSVLRHHSSNPDELYPHITLVRPFSYENADLIKLTVDHVGSRFDPFPILLAGYADFDGKHEHIGVTNTQVLRTLDTGLEECLAPFATFDPPLDSFKRFHATFFPRNDDDRIAIADSPIPYTVRRITAIENKRIWFQYDLATKELLSREEALDPKLWRQTLEYDSHRNP